MTDSTTLVGAARVTPTVSQPVRITWMSWGEQLFAHELPMIEKAANVGVSLVEGSIPGGYLLKMFVGENVVDQLIEQGAKVLEGVMAKQPDIVVDPAKHPIYAYVANMIENQRAASICEARPRS